MQNELVDKYLNSKHKILLSYSSTLYKVYEIEDEKLWNNENEFKDLMDKILRVYINKYYLRDKEDFSKLNIRNLPEKDFKMTLSLAVIADYYKDKYQEIKSTYKKSIYNLTIVLYIITNADKEISFYNRYNVTTKNILGLLNKLFGNVLGDAEIQKNPFVLEMLANKIKEAEKMELRFFESLKDNESYINFIEYEKDVYFVDYNYDLNSLLKYNSEDIKYVYDKYKFKDQFLNIIYDLTAITNLKCFSNNCVVPKFLLPISSNYLKNKNNINYLSKVYSNPYIKDRIYFSTHFSDYKKNYDEYLKLDELGYQLVLFMDKTDIIVDYSNLKFDFKFYVTKDFLEGNPKFMDFANKGNIDFDIIDNVKTYNEDELINICLKKEN